MESNRREFLALTGTGLAAATSGCALVTGIDREEIETNFDEIAGSAAEHYTDHVTVTDAPAPEETELSSSLDWTIRYGPNRDYVHHGPTNHYRLESDGELLNVVELTSDPVLQEFLNEDQDMVLEGEVSKVYRPTSQMDNEGYYGVFARSASSAEQL
ncbi:MAG: hypothetical protein V5A72_00750 [Candidatus Nanohaloarchaea archaeon]